MEGYGRALRAAMCGCQRKLLSDGLLTPQALNAMNPLDVDDPESGGLNQVLQLGPARIRSEHRKV